MKLYTFGLVYRKKDFEHIEEIDVRANNDEEARVKADELVAEMYDPYDDIIEMSAGGSGGLFQAWS